jgi:hypothetical protein
MSPGHKYLLAIFFCVLPFTVPAYGVLTHEAIVDASWDKSMVPLLKEKFPAATDSALQEAHAYAYGGAVSPDMGFYPFGSKLFTNLVHYVRSGDFVDALLRDANTLNEYAFALGFLSHYVADNYGHPMATNRSVPLVYPKLEKKYGRVITYAEDKIAHMRMEFGFDVLEIAKGNYASQDYHNFIGFKVDTTVLAKAFRETYQLDINRVFKNHFQLSVETFRWIVANIFPTLTKAGWVAKKKTIKKNDTTKATKHFSYKMRQKQYDKQFGKGYQRPGFKAALLSYLIRVLPKVGPLRALRFKAPTPQSEKYLEQSIDTVLRHYSVYLQQLKAHELHLKDKDYDTGNLTANCEYSLANETYTIWVLQLQENDFKNINNPLRQNILHFFDLPPASKIHTRKKSDCEKFYKAYEELRSMGGKENREGQ